MNNDQNKVMDQRETREDESHAVRRYRRLSAPKYPDRGALAGLTIHRRTWNPTVTHRQNDAATFMRNAVEAAIKAGASTAIPAAVPSAIDGATVRPIDQK